MKKNRKTTKKMSVIQANTMRFGGILIAFFVMVIFNYLSSSGCNQLVKAKGVLEKELDKLEDSWMRESTRWEEMKTPERVEVALVRHGLLMHHPKPEQTVQMRGDGTPYPAQLSITRAQQRGVMTPARTHYRQKKGR